MRFRARLHFFLGSGALPIAFVAFVAVVAIAHMDSTTSKVWGSTNSTTLNQCVDSSIGTSSHCNATIGLNGLEPCAMQPDFYI